MVGVEWRKDADGATLQIVNNINNNIINNNNNNNDNNNNIRIFTVSWSGLSGGKMVMVQLSRYSAPEIRTPDRALVSHLCIVERRKTIKKINGPIWHFGK